MKSKNMPFLSSWGIDEVIGLAGLAGRLLRILLGQDKGTLSQNVARLLAMFLFAGYVGGWIATFSNLPPTIVGLLCGLIGDSIVGGLILLGSDFKKEPNKYLGPFMPNKK